MLICVSEVCFSAVYDLPVNVFYFLSHVFWELQNIEKENYNFIHMKAVTNIQSLHGFHSASVR